ncbi:MAG: chloride channel protein [Hydrogenophilales bacterium 16-64-46]|nr:MAG: chloride channel protein [Hydrogenophilales bacterium 12-64-13]OYZ07047.1 MAG: chloride channel protein [Hydrogenophilales bacterium 16-64-46]OZA37755.1 MAG: chloride channel protein [Hydrogenophilales bacterium 17-64-34]HQS99294.1 chloride channel protein [Thiobacillus sp.]
MFPLPDLKLVRRRQRVRLLSVRLWARRVLFWTGAVGVGLAATAFALGSDSAQAFFHQLIADRPWLPLLVTPLTLALVAALTQRFFKGAEGSGIPQTIAALRMPDGRARDQVLSLKTAFGKTLLTCLGMAGGASVGREGPTVQIGAALLYNLRWLIRFPIHMMERGLIVAGGAAGVAAAFNTPLAGIVFAIEEMARSFEERSSGTLLTAVIIAGLAAIYVQGDYTYFGESSAALSGVRGWAAVLVCGIAGGLLGGGFSRVLLGFTLKGLPGQLGIMVKAHPVSFAASCGLALALIGMASGSTAYGSGYEEARRLIEGGEAPAAGYAFWKMLATFVSFISGIPGGLFAPSLSAGAGVGQALADLFGMVDGRALAIVGMAAYFAGVVQAPITAFVIVMEMTANHDMVVPLMLATLIAAGVSRMVCPRPLYKALADGFLARQHANPHPTARS